MSRLTLGRFIWRPYPGLWVVTWKISAPSRKSQKSRQSRDFLSVYSQASHPLALTLTEGRIPLKKKPSLFGQMSKKSSPMAMDMPKQPEEIRLRKTDNNGFIGSLSGGEMGYGGKDHAFTNPEDAKAFVDAFLGGKKPKKDAESKKETEENEESE